MLCSGADFYSDPELSDTGVLAWTEWNHPAMPWDATQIRRGRLVDGARSSRRGATSPAVRVRVGRAPALGTGRRADLRLGPHGLVEPLRLRQGMVAPLFPDDAEYATPQWVFGDQPYAVLGSGRILVSGSVAVSRRSS